MTGHHVVVMTDRLLVDQVPVVRVLVDRVRVVRIAIVMSGRVVVEMIVATRLHVRKLQRSAKQMKFITVLVVASTEKSRCQLPSTPSSVGKMMVQ